MPDKISFMLPGFYEHYEPYKVMLTIFQQHPEILNTNTEVYCAYGNIPFCTWDGGRIFKTYKPANVEKMVEIQKCYNEILGIPVRLIFTNNLLTEEDCYDAYNNLVLQVFHNGQNEIVVNSPILEKYLLEHYPDYNYISSTTKCLTNVELAKEELHKDQYKLVCLDYNLNHNWEFLNKLTQEEKSKVELLVNPICGPGCPNRKEHYRLNSLFSLTYGKPYKMRNCSITNSILHPHDWPTIIKPEEIYDKYFIGGFNHFKLEGRSLSDITTILIVAQYLVKPEYQGCFVDTTCGLLREYDEFPMNQINTKL